MNSKLFLAAFVVVVAATSSGCATVTKGSSQAVTLHTDPEGATCDMAREAKIFASLAATPGQVQVGREWGAIDISCRKTGHQTTDLRVESSVEGWTMGNILIGGIIGFAVDAASGAMRQYPQFVTLTLVPEEFASFEDRDRYAKERLARFEREAATAAELLGRTCSPEACPNDYRVLQATRDERVALLHKRLANARVRQPATAKPSEPGAPPVN